jgi:hypothetical protein
MALGVLAPSVSYAQKKDSTRVAEPDSLRKRLDPAQRDSLFYSNLKRRMEKRKLTSDLYHFLFREPYNSNARQEVSKIEENPFKPFEGKVIRNVVIRRLDVFGPSVYDTTRVASNWFERFANNLHRNTREGVIRRSFLLFKEGENLNPDILKDNERLLRQQAALFHDARILVIPVETFRNVVDVLVITQDVWSLVPTDAGFGGFGNFGLAFTQQNVRGLGHSWLNGFRYNRDAPRQRWEYYTRYQIPYIGRTYSSGTAYFSWLQDIKRGGIRWQKDFLTPETKYAGAAEINLNRENRFVYFDEESDSLLLIRDLTFATTDLWFGRAFKIGFYNEELKDRARLIVALRRTSVDYFQRPTLTPDSNQIYQERQTYLVSVGLSNRRYRRDVLIYGFGRTEDVPVGGLYSIVAGLENAELGHRRYFGLKAARGSYLLAGGKPFGYLYVLSTLGGYLKQDRIEQGIFRAEANYFSPLMRWGRSNFRQFVNVRYIAGLNRFSNEFVTINNTEGLRGVRSNALRGTRSLTLGLETVFFSPMQFIGFRMAIFGYADLGLVTNPGRSLFSSPVYQGYGLGFRFRNENLTFNTFQIRLGYYPNIPLITNPLRTELSGETPLRFNDFLYEAPDQSDRFRSQL